MIRETIEEQETAGLSKIRIKIIAKNPELVPIYATLGAAGADLRADLKEEVIIEPGTSVLIPTGIRIELPSGYEMQIRPRSGLALKNQVTVLNTPGTIDCDYRGEIKVILMNHGRQNFSVTPLMRIAQGVITRYVSAFFEEVAEIDQTGRGDSGFGHTGIS